MAMKLVKKTDEYSIYQRSDDRYAVKDVNKNAVNGDDKVRILVAEELIKASLPAEPEPEQEPEPEETAEEESPAEETEAAAEEPAAEEAAPAAEEEAPADEAPAEDSAEEDEDK